MGLPPRPKGRLLVRRALVASMLTTAACDSGAKPKQAEPDRKELPPAPRPDAKPDPVQEPPRDVMPIAPQVAYATGFNLEIYTGPNKPLANTAVTITTDKPFVTETDERGSVYVSTPVGAPMQLKVEAAGYQPADVHIEGGMYPTASVVLKKQKASR